MIFFSLQMVLSACFSLLVGCVCHRLWVAVRHHHMGAPEESLGPSCVFYCFFCIWSCWGAFETQPITKLFIILVSPQASFCCELELIICWTAQKEMGNADGPGAEEALGSQMSLQACGDLLAELCLFFVWEPFNLFSWKIADTCWGSVNCGGCTKGVILGVPVPPWAQLRNSFTKGCCVERKSLLISEQYKFFSSETVASPSVVCLILLSKYQENHSFFWTSESLAHLISHSREECQFALLCILLPCLQLDLHVLYFPMSVHPCRKHL